MSDEGVVDLAKYRRDHPKKNVPRKFQTDEDRVGNAITAVTGEQITKIISMVSKVIRDVLSREWVSCFHAKLLINRNLFGRGIRFTTKVEIVGSEICASVTVTTPEVGTIEECINNPTTSGKNIF